VVVALVALAACSSDDDSSATDDASSPSVPESATERPDVTASAPGQQHEPGDDPTAPTASPALGVGTEPPGPTTTAPPAYIAPPATLPGRAAEDIAAEPLSLTGVRVFPAPRSGEFALTANVMNTGADFLNDLRFTATISDDTGGALDQLQVTIPALSAGETTTIHATGGADYDDGWSAVAVAEVAWSA
jgi:hypothetical protein